MNFNCVILVGLVGFVAGQTTIAPKPTPDPNFKCPVEEGYFAHPKDCASFYECSGFNAWLLHCEAPLLWNQDITECDWPQNVKCSSAHAPSGARIQPHGQEIIGPGDYNCTEENGAFPHETLCEFYYDCWEGYASLGRCTEGYLFDLTYSGCNYPNQVNCGSRLRPNGTTNPTTKKPKTTTTRLPGTGPTSSPPFECPDLEEALYPNPEDCGSYYQCLAGYAFLIECPVPLVFNPKTDNCDYKSNVPECQ